MPQCQNARMHCLATIHFVRQTDGQADEQQLITLHAAIQLIHFPEPFSKIRANRLPVFIICFLPLATLLQFLGYVLAHHFLAQLHEQKSLNHLEIFPPINISHLSNSALFLLRTIVLVIVVIALFLYCIFKIYSAAIQPHVCNKLSVYSVIRLIKTIMV